MAAASRRRLAYLLATSSFYPRTPPYIDSITYLRLSQNRASVQGFLCCQRKILIMSSSTQRSLASTLDAVQELTTLLQQAGQPSKKQWWERYLKNEIEFYGTPMADIRSAVKTWISNQDQVSTAQLRSLAWSMFRQPIAEQKLAAILILQHHILPIQEMDASRDLPEIAQLFEEGYIYDWNTTDWLCVRVLGKLMEQDDGASTANLISNWVHNGTTLWQRRAALVSFVNLAPTGLHANLILETAAVLVQDSQLFAQTGVGWILRSLSDAHPDQVYAFLKEHQKQISVEGMRMAAARLSDSKRKALGVTGKRKRR